MNVVSLNHRLTADISPGWLLCESCFRNSVCEIVFTVSDRLIPLFTANPERMYRLLMKVAWDQLERELTAAGVQPGAIIVLHTWNQRLQLHPHLHCLIPVAAQYEYQQSTERVGERSINSLPSPAGTNGNWDERFASRSIDGSVNWLTSVSCVFLPNWPNCKRLVLVGNG